MSVSMNEYCEKCGRVIRKDDIVIEMKIGKARKRGNILRNMFGLLKSSPKGIGWVHLRCVDPSIEFDPGNPHLALEEAME